MTSFIRVGEQFVNVDQITQVRIATSGVVYVYFLSHPSDYATFKGEMATAVLAYLTEHAVDVIAWHQERQAAEAAIQARHGVAAMP